MAEFYIRAPGAEEARGPFDEEKMSSLVGAGQITLETEFYDEAKSAWVAVGESATMIALLFPEKKKLGLKHDHDDIQFLNKPEETTGPAITISQMLAAAEGESKETKYLKEAQKKQDKAAAMAMPVLTVMMVLSGLSNVLPRYAVLIAAVIKHQFVPLLQDPFAIVGFFDFFLAVCLFLNVLTIFPLVRFRAMVGLGYFCVYYWSLGDPRGLVASICAGLGVFVCTITLNLYLMIIFAVLGVLGMGSLAYLAWMGASGG
jgi:hypothetical protein